MRTRIPRPALFLAALALLVACAVAGTLALRSPAAPRLTVSFLDVGQGDAILVEGPTGVQMLIDGGKDRSVLRRLPEVMGPLDRTIDVVLATHPDADHIGGLPDVLARYRVRHFFEQEREGESAMVARLEASAREEEGVERLDLVRGMRIDLGGGAYADVLHPEGNAEMLRETNDASVSLRVVYGGTEFLLTGDAPEWVEERIVEAYGDRLASDVLKAGHHGSKTSTGPALLAAARPGIVVVSAGKDNSYGHPDPGVVERVLDSGATLLSTIDLGTVTLVTDGTSLSQE